MKRTYNLSIPIQPNEWKQIPIGTTIVKNVAISGQPTATAKFAGMLNQRPYRTRTKPQWAHEIIIAEQGGWLFATDTDAQMAGRKPEPLTKEQKLDLVAEKVREYRRGDTNAYSLIHDIEGLIRA